MMRFCEEFRVNVPSGAALEYVADFATLPEWEPSVVAVTQAQGSGPEPGARYRVRMRFAGRESAIDYRCVKLTDTTAEMQGTGEGFVARDVITVAPETTGETAGATMGCRVRYEVHVELQTLFARLTRPVIHLLFARNVRAAARRLQTRLNALEAA